MNNSETPHYDSIFSKVFTASFRTKRINTERIFSIFVHLNQTSSILQPILCASVLNAISRVSEREREQRMKGVLHLLFKSLHCIMVLIVPNMKYCVNQDILFHKLWSIAFANKSTLINVCVGVCVRVQRYVSGDNLVLNFVYLYNSTGWVCSHFNEFGLAHTMDFTNFVCSFLWW